MEQFYKPKEVAAILHVTTQTVWEWIKTGRLSAVTLPNGTYRVCESEIKTLLEKKTSIK